jgi:hypothetical protein
MFQQASQSGHPSVAVARTGEVKGAPQLIKAADAKVGDECRDAYVGNTFSNVQKALGSKSNDPDAPSF